MAHSPTAHSESGRTETVDLSSSGSKSTGDHRLTGYAGLAITVLILIAVLFVQGTTTG